MSLSPCSLFTGLDKYFIRSFMHYATAINLKYRVELSDVIMCCFAKPWCGSGLLEASYIYINSFVDI